MNKSILKERKNRTQKGITLVALIITIIVLLILAMVAIREVQGDGIIAHAKNARDEHEMAKIKEEAELVKLEKQIELSTKGNGQLAKEALVGYLKEHFTGSTVDENIVTTKDGKYDIIVDDALNITVVKHGGSIEETDEIKIEYTVTGKTVNLKFTLDIDKTIKSYEQYVAEDLKNKNKGELEDTFMKLMGEEGNLDDLIAAEGITREQFEAMIEQETGMEYEDYLKRIAYEGYKEGYKRIIATLSNGEEFEVKVNEEGIAEKTYAFSDFGEYSLEAKNGKMRRTCKIILIDHSEVVVSTVAKTGVYASSPNIKEVRKGVKADIPIPNGFTYIKGDDIGGAVISDHINEITGESDGNEFVWVPVGDINNMVMCQACGANSTDENGEEIKLDTTTLQCTKCGKNTKLAGKLYSTSNGDNFKANLTGQTYTAGSGHREPDNLTGSGYEDNALRFTGTNVIWSETLYEDSFKTMAESVATYKGFYVGRYEMSYSGAAKSIANAKSAIGDANNWWGLYAKTKTYTNAANSVESEMIWGSQYDAMMRWMADNGITVTVPTPTDLSIGVTVKNSDSGRITGSQPKDKLSNIYDLLGNGYERTQETCDGVGRVFRGGGAGVEFTNGDLAPSPSYRNTNPATVVSDIFSSRLSLYVK